MSDETRTSQESSTISEWKKRHAAYEKKKTESQEGVTSLKSNQIAQTQKLKKTRKQKKKAAKVVKKSNRIRRKMGLPYLVISLITIIISLYYITPLSTAKRITIDGLNNESVEHLISVSGIEDSDYITSFLLHKGSFEKNMVKGSDWISEASIIYTFPNEFLIEVAETDIVAYTQTDQGYAPILQDGTIINEKVDSLPDTFLILNLEKAKYYKQFVEEISEVDKDIVNNMHIVTMAGDTVTKDLVQIEMYDGNTVLIPISDISEKLGYYNLVASQLSTATIIDMEVGIYTHADSSAASSTTEESTVEE